MTERIRDEKGLFVSSHGMTDSILYSKWSDMKRRCNNPHDQAYRRYGAKGIKVCPEWEDSFENFYEWSMDNGYKDGLTIDRIDNSKGYSPDNCRWATMLEQSRNTSRNILFTHNGKTQCLSAWAEEFGIDQKKAWKRFKLGNSFEDIFSTNDLRLHGKEITYKGKTQTINKWSEETGINRTTIITRLKSGFDLDRVFSTKDLRKMDCLEVSPE